jgi:pimeloyl-ACP methyl ester carboxylesterase
MNSAPTNSTNVRSTHFPLEAATSSPLGRGRRRPLALRAARAAVRLLSPTAPALAARYAEHLFVTPRRHRRPLWEANALSDAAPLRIPHDGTFLPAWRWGSPSAPVVLLVHGWEGRGSQLAMFVEPLLERGLSVVTFDAPGHGDAPTRTASVVEHGRAVASVAAAVGPLHGVIGYSIGAAAALYATRLGLDTKRLALIAPPVSPLRFAAGFAELLGMSPDVHQGMLTRLEQRFGVRMDELDVRPDAARFAAPILVVHDVGDQVVPIDNGAAIAALAPQGRLLETHGLGHRRVLRAPEVLAALIPFIAGEAHALTFEETLDGELFCPALRRQSADAKRDAG